MLSRLRFNLSFQLIRLGVLLIPDQRTKDIIIMQLHTAGKEIEKDLVREEVEDYVRQSKQT